MYIGFAEKVDKDRSCYTDERTNVLYIILNKLISFINNFMLLISLFFRCFSKN